MNRRQFIGSTVAAIAMPALAGSWAGNAASETTQVLSATAASPSEPVWRIEGWDAHDGADAPQDDVVWIRMNSSGQCAWR